MQTLEDKLKGELPALRRYAISLTRDQSQADDLVQDCVERALTRFHQFEEGTNLRGWLCTILYSLFINECRKHARRQRSVSIDEAPVTSSSYGPDEALMVRDMDRALDQLPDTHKRIVLMVGVEGRSYEAAAQICRIPIGTVRSRLFRAREVLRRWDRDDLADAPGLAHPEEGAHAA